MYFLMFKGSFQDLRFRVLEFEGFRFLGFGGAPPGVILTFGMVQGLTFCREREREAGGGGGEEGEEGGSNHNPTFTSIRSPVPPGSHKGFTHRVSDFRKLLDFLTCSPATVLDTLFRMTFYVVGRRSSVC